MQKSEILNVSLLLLLHCCLASLSSECLDEPILTSPCVLLQLCHFYILLMDSAPINLSVMNEPWHLLGRFNPLPENRRAGWMCRRDDHVVLAGLKDLIWEKFG